MKEAKSKRKDRGKRQQEKRKTWKENNKEANEGLLTS